MEAISRRRWFQWSVAAGGALALGCRTPGLGEPTLNPAIVQPGHRNGRAAAAESGPAAIPAGSPTDIPASGVSMRFEDGLSASIWTDRFEDALARAAAEEKWVLAFFTGSDFCQPCQRLRKEVIETPAFQTWAAERFVLLELDYPRRTPQPEPLQEQNRQLLKRYQVNSFPTVLVLTSGGEVVAQNNSYRGGGPETWIGAIDDQLSSY